MVAKLKPVKRVDIFLQAIAYLHNSKPEIDFRSIILGGGAEYNTLEWLAKHLGIVIQSPLYRKCLRLYPACSISI